VWKIKEGSTEFLLWISTITPHSKNNGLVVDPGAEGAGSGCLSGGKGGGGPPAGQAPRPPCAAVFAARYGGRGRRRQPGSVAVWTGARLCLWRARPHPVATLTEATAQHGSYGVIPIRYVAGIDDGLTYAFGLFPIALGHGLAG
jgi:hypothetical protein